MLVAEIASLKHKPWMIRVKHIINCC